MELTSRERVRRVLNRGDFDRLPIDFGGTVVTSIDYYAHKRLCEHLKIPNGERPIIDYSIGTVEPCETLMRLFRSDFRRVGLNVGNIAFRGDTFENGFGIKLRRARPHAYYDMIAHPMQEPTVRAVEAMRLPDPDDPALYEGLADRARALYEDSGFAVVADFGVPGFFETSQKLRGYENLACDILLEREFIEALYERLLALQVRFFRNYLDRVAPFVEAVGYAEDLGMQDRLQISPATFRAVVLPYHKKILKFIHDRYDVKVLLHSCGSIASILPDLIEAGFDLINPVQTRARDMDPHSLKERFGDRCVFWGGFDEQMVLPRGTPEQIDREARDCMRVLGRDGGYVFAVSHNIQQDTPAPNIVAAFEAAWRHCGAV